MFRIIGILLLLIGIFIIILAFFPYTYPILGIIILIMIIGGKFTNYYDY